MLRAPALLLALIGCHKKDEPVADLPHVVATVPEDGAVGVSPQTAIRVTFDRALDPDTLSAAGLALDPAASGALSWDGASNTATLVPDGLLGNGVWSVHVGGDLADPDGLAVVPYDFSFTVGAGAGSSATYTDGVYTTTVTVDDRDTLERTYTLTTNAPQRDGGPTTRTFSERPGQMVLRSGSDISDALFALAMVEADLLSVSEITDGAFSNGAPVPCDCFQTGELWHYVWTRDTAYAMDLGLALVDPSRARRSLEFKLSADKAAVGAGGLQIVQDTGTGGSWPVSTDRVVWALGASRVLQLLDGAERTAFRDLALQAVVNTAETDRVHAYDPDDGLYRGETSFLDWREQTYPSWTASDVLHVAEGKALSTNVGHHALLDLAARLSAEVGDTAGEARYRGWADQLAADIEAGFHVDGAGYARVLPNALDAGPLGQQDWLGTALVALSVADPGNAADAIGRYPQGAWGPPVIWPQQPLTPIYHNRAIWPFVTAYGVRAAVAVGNEAVAARGAESLVRGAALNLSNMENLEVLSGLPWVDDGAYSGPVVDSRRQLWSVAAYFAMTFDLLGLRPTDAGLEITPWLPEDVRAARFPGAEIALYRVPYKGRTFDLVLTPGASGGGPQVAGTVAVDGVALAGPLDADLSDGSVVAVALVAGPAADEVLTEIVDDGDFTRVFAPRAPAVTGLALAGGLLELSLDDGGDPGVVLDVWRDGAPIATGVTGASWTDPGSAAHATTSYCYAVAARFPSGTSSQRSQPVCWWGASGERVQWLDAYHLDARGGGQWGAAPDHWWDWGDADHALVATGIRANWTGEHALQVVHANGAGPISTGITTGHKWVTVTDPTGAVVGEGAAVLPQSGSWTAYRDSTALRVWLDAGTSYTITVSDAPNMSRLDHFTAYTAGLGGGSSAYNRVDVSGIKLLPLSGADLTPTTGALVALDGSDDLGKLGANQTVVPGAALQPWEAVALTWDADWLYLAWVSQAFEDDWAPLVIYLQGTQGAPGPAVPSTGLSYSGQVPELPFTPTHAVSLRNLSDPGTGEPPWDGVRARDGGAWNAVRRFAPGRDRWLAADLHTLSARVPRSTLGDPDHLRLAAHVVNAVPGAEWVDTVPATHAPWAVGGGGYYEIDLTGPTPAAGWVLR